jgi:hypothetical protein
MFQASRQSEVNVEGSEGLRSLANLPSRSDMADSQQPVQANIYSDHTQPRLQSYPDQPAYCLCIHAVHHLTDILNLAFGENQWPNNSRSHGPALVLTPTNHFSFTTGQRKPLGTIYSVHAAIWIPILTCCRQFAILNKYLSGFDHC